MFIVPLAALPSIFPVQPDIQSQQQTFTANLPFANVLADAMQTVEETQKVSSANSFQLALGQTDDLHNIQIDSMKAATAINFAAGLASKAISAYTEILRMNI